MKEGFEYREHTETVDGEDTLQVLVPLPRLDLYQCEHALVCDTQVIVHGQRRAPGRGCERVAEAPGALWWETARGNDSRCLRCCGDLRGGEGGMDIALQLTFRRRSSYDSRRTRIMTAAYHGHEHTPRARIERIFDLPTYAHVAADRRNSHEHARRVRPAEASDGLDGFCTSGIERDVPVLAVEHQPREVGSRRGRRGVPNAKGAWKCDPKTEGGSGRLESCEEAMGSHLCPGLADYPAPRSDGR